MRDRATSDIGPFAIVPDRVIRADISDRAVRLFAVLARYTNREMEAIPSRRRLADDLRASRDSVDRAIKERVAIGAVEVEARVSDSGDSTSNLYRLLYARTASREPAPEVIAEPVPDSGGVSKSQAQASAASREAGLRAVFDSRFWPAYPRKLNRPAALRVFLRLAPEPALLDLMLSALEKQKAMLWAGIEARFIPHAATWLNGERWLDEVQMARRSPGRTGAPEPGKYAGIEQGHGGGRAEEDTP